jgi:hypothetical protein
MKPPTIPTDPEAPLPERILRFCDHYVHSRDLKKAAIACGFEPEDGSKLFRFQRVKDEIKRRTALVEGEDAKLIATERAKVRKVNTPALDKALMEMVKIKPKDVLGAPTLAASKVKAVELGYRRLGLLVDDNFIPDVPTGPVQVQSPRIFRPTEQTILTHQETITHEVRTTREVVSVPEPLTIDASDFTY